MLTATPDRLLKPLQQKLAAAPINNPRIARLICSLIPDRCPFERRIYLFGRLIGHIPSLCKLNPFYRRLMDLRLRAIDYLAELEAEQSDSD